MHSFGESHDQMLPLETSRECFYLLFDVFRKWLISRIRGREWMLTLKVRKSQKQINMISYPPKNEWNICLIMYAL